MKVLHVITGLNDGGAEGVLYRLVKNSVNHRHVIISLMDKGKYGSLLEDLGVKVYCLDMNPGKPSFKKLWHLLKLIRAESPDAVQTWMYHADLLGGVASKVAGVKRVYWGVRQSILEEGKAKKSTIAVARLCGVFSRAIPSKIIVCAHQAIDFHTSLGYLPEKCVVIQNGYDLSKFKRDGEAGDATRALIGVSRETFLIGKIGRFNPIKDHENLFAALSELQALGLDFKCLLVGRGLSESNTELLTKLNALGLRDKIILAGQRTDIPAVMNALDLHVLSSSSEGFPNVLAEAMACGTPAVSTDVGDAGEIVGDKRLLCPPRNPRALSDLIHKMHTEWLESSEAWADRRIMCSEHIKKKFSVERMVAAYENCWFDT